MKAVFAAAALFLLDGCASQVTSNPCAADGQLQLILTVDTPQIHANSFAKVRVFLQNNSNRTYHLVQPGDGSDVGWRTPSITWYVDGNQQDVDFRDNPVINPLAPGELFDIAPGARVQLNSWVGGVELRDPGSHDVMLRYRNDPAMTWLGTTGDTPHDPRAMAKVRVSDAVNLMSCPQKISVSD